MRPKLNLKSKSQMPLSHEHVGSKILAKIKMYTLTRAELLFNLCYEIPCRRRRNQDDSRCRQSPMGRIMCSLLFRLTDFFLFQEN